MGILRNTHVRFQCMHPADFGNYILTLVKIDSPTRIGRLFGVMPRIETVRYHGSSTVWHEYPDFERCPTWKEVVLSQIWNKEMHKNGRRDQGHEEDRGHGRA